MKKRILFIMHVTNLLSCDDFLAINKFGRRGRGLKVAATTTAGWPIKSWGGERCEPEKEIVNYKPWIWYINASRDKRDKIKFADFTSLARGHTP